MQAFEGLFKINQDTQENCCIIWENCFSAKQVWFDFQTIETFSHIYLSIDYSYVLSKYYDFMKCSNILQKQTAVVISIQEFWKLYVN
jgi:hypothetical protein